MLIERETRELKRLPMLAVETQSPVQSPSSRWGGIVLPSACRGVAVGNWGSKRQPYLADKLNQTLRHALVVTSTRSCEEAPVTCLTIAGGRISDPTPA